LIDALIFYTGCMAFCTLLWDQLPPCYSVGITPYNSHKSHDTKLAVFATQLRCTPYQITMVRFPMVGWEEDSAGDTM